MRSFLQDNRLTLYLEGRIRTPEMRGRRNRRLWQRSEENPGVDLALDAENLEYISSAGLRVLMKLRKQTGKTLSIWNVSPAVYEIFDTTGFTDLLDVHKALREVSVDGCEIIGRGSFGIVYRLDPEMIVKVYQEGVSLEQLQEEKRNATAAFVHEIPTAIAYDTVKVGNCYGNVYELLNAVTVGKAITAEPSRAEELGRKMGQLLKKVHETEIEPGVLPRISDRLRARVDYMEERHLSHEDAELLRQVLDAIPEKNTLVHGDFQEGNVMVQDGELLLIDLDSICVGNPLHDYMSSFGLHKLGSTKYPKLARLSLNLEPELIPIVAAYERSEFLGTDDPAVLDHYVETMELLFSFRQLFVIALEQSNRSLTSEMIEGIKKHSLPVFRENVQKIIKAVEQF